MKPAIERFNAKWVLDPTTGCWLWTAALDRKGYGRFCPHSITVLAHRWSYEYHIGPIPEGLELDHVKDRGCTNRHCVNPAHLEPVTHVLNCQRGDGGLLWASKTHCPQGHEYTPENTYVDSRGSRNCRSCNNEKSLARFHTKKKKESCSLSL